MMQRTIWLAVMLFFSACDSGGRSTDTEAVSVVSALPGHTVYVDTLPACRECRLSLLPIGTIGATGDSVLLRGVPVLASDRNGFVYAAVPYASDHEILRYAPNGQLLGTIGRYGTGPGEYRFVLSLTLYQDTLLVVAHDNMYISEFLTDGSHVRTIAVTPRVSGPVMRVSEDHYVMTGRLPVAASAGHPVHFVSRAGDVELSAGTDDVLTPNGRRVRAFGSVRGGRFWIGETGTYRLEAIDFSGNVGRTIGITAPQSFYSATFMTREEAERARAQAQIRRNISAEFAARPDRLPVAPGLRITSLGHLDQYLVVIANVAAPGWSEVEVTYRSGSEPVLDNSVQPRVYQTVVDIIDPSSGMLLARARTPGFGSLANDSVLATMHADEYGVISATLYQLRFDPGRRH